MKTAIYDEGHIDWSCVVESRDLGAFVDFMKKHETVFQAQFIGLELKKVGQYNENLGALLSVRIGSGMTS